MACRPRHRRALVPPRIAALVTVTLVIALVSAATPARSEPTAAPKPAGPAGQARCTIEIRPEMELLAGALAQTDWMQLRGPNGEGNEYFRALKAFFSPYQEHPAVKMLQEFTIDGFSFELPPAFICHVGPLPDLPLKYEYSANLVKAAGSRAILEELRLALRDLAQKSHFQEFVDRWQSSYDKWLGETGDFMGEQAAEWLEGFFGSRAAEYHLVITPAMFPKGGYAAAATLPDGKRALFALIREPGRSIFDPEIPTGSELTSMVLHEWGHSFVNPELEAVPAQTAKLRTLYWRTMRAMKRQGYGSLEAFLDEQVLRAVTCLAAGDFWGPQALAEEANYHERDGFYLTRPAIELLREYQAERARYTTFASFLPTLLTGLNAFRVRIPAWAIAGGLALLGLYASIKLRRAYLDYVDRRRRWLGRQPWIWK